MKSTDLKPSTRLLRAADAEREGIERQRARLAEQRTRLAAELAGVEASLATLAEREALLGRLVAEQAEPGMEQRPAGLEGEDAGVVNSRGASAARRDVLRGPEIRETAVAVLCGTREAGAIHYRAWYEMIVAAGYDVAGKDPLAVFLTQISRSPVVKRSTQAGVYTLDLDAPTRLRGELARLESGLREVASGGAADLSEIRARREHVLSEIRKTERALAEAERVLGCAPTDERHAARA
ncbi:MAG: hypothetical protein ABSB69_13995 [Solirubrobacteraceae bacterium]